MSTLLQIPRSLGSYSAGKLELTVDGNTVREVLESVRRTHPSLYGCICDETGAVRRHVNLFVNNDFLRDREGLDTRLETGDVVAVFQAVSGG